MRIGFDLDKIFVNYPPLVPDKLIDRLYKKKSNGELIYRFPRRLEQLFRKVTHLPLFRQPIKENIDFLSSINSNEHVLYLISSRFSFLRPETEKLIQKLGLNKKFAKLYFNFQDKQPHEFKDEVIRKLHLQAYVDDDFPLLKYVAKRNKKTMFYWLTNTKKKQMLTRNIAAINKLSDIFSEK